MILNDFLILKKNSFAYIHLIKKEILMIFDEFFLNVFFFRITELLKKKLSHALNLIFLIYTVNNKNN